MRAGLRDDGVLARRDAVEARQRDHRAAHTAVGDEQVAAAADDAVRQADATQLADGPAQLLDGVRLEKELGRAADAPGGERRETPLAVTAPQPIGLRHRRRPPLPW